MQKGFKMKTLWGCKWKKGECAAKANFIQPTAPKCDSICCTLNKRSCMGKGAYATKWQKANGEKLKKKCKFTRDQTRTIKTPDGKAFGACMTK